MKHLTIKHINKLLGSKTIDSDTSIKHEHKYVLHKDDDVITITYDYRGKYASEVVIEMPEDKSISYSNATLQGLYRDILEHYNVI